MEPYRQNWFFYGIMKHIFKSYSNAFAFAQVPSAVLVL